MSKMDTDRLMAEARKIFSDQIWELNMENLSRFKRGLVRFIKLVRITFNEFAENRMGFQCVALSYFVALSIVPFAAFVFAVGGGMGVADKISELLYTLLPSYPDLVGFIVDKAEGIVDIARSGAVGLISALTFLWAVLWLMFQVERVFNNVWKIRKIPRRIYKRFSFYIAALMISPFVILVFGAGIALYTNVTGLIGIHIKIKELSFITTLMGWTVFYAIAAFTFSAMYKFIPAVEVKYRYALRSSLVSALIFVLFQYIYLEAQLFVSRLNGVYGAIAAIPLFLMWVNYSWQIIIYGEQLCYGMQNIDKYNIPEGSLRDFTPLLDRLKAEREMEEPEQ
ncbi:MAG: YihY/virulence factor BrkB family protein [Bacteroidia bacterium]|nr:YihY/virulence factor BrkB family protein [Bacteroidia bacterium]